MTRAVVVFSGGQDSTTCLYWAKQKFGNVHALTFNYNQKHNREIEAAKRIAGLAGVTHEVVDLGPVLKGRSPLTNPEESLETYDSFERMDATIGDRVELTFVPMRNALFLVIAANRAAVLGASAVVTGVCEADNANYPDCRATFVTSLEDTIAKALGLDKLGTRMAIETPLLGLSKADTVRLAMSLPGCYEALGYSHTAYSGEFPPRTQDHATVLRAEGFRRAGVPDPLIVRAKLECGEPLPVEPHYVVAAEAVSLRDLAYRLGAA